MACPIFPGGWTLINLTEKYPGYKILDRNSSEYQLEAFIYTCVMLLFYTIATGAFMVKFVLQASREPWEQLDVDSPGASGLLPMVVKIREQERHRKIVERQARKDVKMRMIKQLKQMSNASSLTGIFERRTSGESSDATQVTSFSSFERRLSGGKGRRSSMSGANLIPRYASTRCGSHSPLLPLIQRHVLIGENNTVWSGSPSSLLSHTKSWDQQSDRYQNQYATDASSDDTLVIL